jgi:hypothetical protein
VTLRKSNGDAVWVFGGWTRQTPWMGSAVAEQ